MKHGGPPSNIEIANRFAGVMARKYFKALGGKVPLEDLLSFAGEGAAEALSRWDGRGRFDHFALQRIRWRILGDLRREVFCRGYDGARRDEICALVATERTSDTFDESPDEAGALPSPVDLVEESAGGYRLELVVADEEAANVADPEVDPEADVERFRVRAAISQLPAPEDVVLDRYWYGEETIVEIATALDRSPSTVHGIYRRGMQRLLALFGVEPTAELTGAPVTPIGSKRAASVTPPLPPW